MNMQFQSLTPNLMVKDVTATVAYYEKLGFQVVNSVPEQAPFVWAEVQLGQVHIMFQEERSIKEEYPELRQLPLVGSFTLYIKIQSLENFFEQIKDQVKIIKPIHKLFYGALEFSIQDLNGYILTFSENL